MELGLYNDHTVLTPYNTPRVTTLFVGKTGKSTALARLALNDLYNSIPFVFIGNAEIILEHAPKSKSVLYVSPSEKAFSCNVLHDVTAHAQFASTLTEALIKPGITPFREYTFKTYFRFGVQTLLQIPGTNLLCMKKLYTDSTYRTKLVNQLTDPVLKDFWNDFEDLPDKDKRLNIESTLAVLYDMLLEPRIRNCLFQKKNALDFSKTIIVSLNEAELGKDNVSLMGSIILASLYASGVNTTLYVDDAERFPIMETIASSRLHTVYSLRKLDFIVADQVVAFRTTVKDAELLQFNLKPDDYKLPALPKHRAYVQNGESVVELFMPNIWYPHTKYGTQIRNKRHGAPPHIIEKRLGSFFNE